jgi:hypothetical protein
VSSHSSLSFSLNPYRIVLVLSTPKTEIKNNKKNPSSSSIIKKKKKEAHFLCDWDLRSIAGGGPVALGLTFK